MGFGRIRDRWISTLGINLKQKKKVLCDERIWRMGRSEEMREKRNKRGGKKERNS